MGDVYVGSGGAWGDAAVPVEPVGARFGFPRGPAFASVIRCDPQQPLGGSGGDARRESGDFSFESLERNLVKKCGVGSERVFGHGDSQKVLISQPKLVMGYDSEPG